MADGYLDKAEEELLIQAINIFGIDSNLFEINKENLVRNYNAYNVLGVSENMSFADIKNLSKKRKEFHPDTLLSKGLPDELLEKLKKNL